MSKDLLENSIDLSIFEKVKHISLNDEDLLFTFVDYVSLQNLNEKEISSKYKERLFKNYTILNSNLFDKLWEIQEFSNLIQFSTREAVFLAILSISLDDLISDTKFLEICKSLNFFDEKKKIISLITQNLALKKDLLSCKKELTFFFIDYEKEIYSSIISRNKDFISSIDNNKIDSRKSVFYNFIEHI